MSSPPVPRNAAFRILSLRKTDAGGYEPRESQQIFLNRAVLGWLEGCSIWKLSLAPGCDRWPANGKQPTAITASVICLPLQMTQGKTGFKNITVLIENYLLPTGVLYSSVRLSSNAGELQWAGQVEAVGLLSSEMYTLNRSACPFMSRCNFILQTDEILYQVLSKELHGVSLQY